MLSHKRQRFMEVAVLKHRLRGHVDHPNPVARQGVDIRSSLGAEHKRGATLADLSLRGGRTATTPRGPGRSGSILPDTAMQNFVPTGNPFRAGLATADTTTRRSFAPTPIHGLAAATPTRRRRRRQSSAQRAGGSQLGHDPFRQLRHLRVGRKDEQHGAIRQTVNVHPARATVAAKDFPVADVV